MRKCACCGNILKDENDPFEICDFCDWQRDDVMEKQPDKSGGANGKLSLEKARELWNRFHKPLTSTYYQRQ